MNLTEAARQLHETRAALARHEAESKSRTTELKTEIARCNDLLMKSQAGIDFEKVALAKTIVYATIYANGGKERASCVQDAIQQLATGTPIRPKYGDLFNVSFSTKNYAHWIGQRSDCTYGMSPRHGSICFEVGLTEEARKRGYDDFTADEIEAAIYYLNNLERIQDVEKKAKEAA